MLSKMEAGVGSAKTRFLNLSIVQKRDAKRHPRAHLEVCGSEDEKTTFLNLSVVQTGKA
jgi:hypothetical protein